MAWRSTQNNGKIVFYDIDHIGKAFSLSLPCGQCIGCRLEYSRQWAIRCMHESTLHDQSCFITLTYSDDNLPEHGTLILRDFQLFMKRLRFEFSNVKIRFYHCGEYGEKFGRPHYHALLFGIDFEADRTLYSQSKQGSKLYVSDTLNKLWNKGFATIGNITFESAAYVARYVVKKSQWSKKRKNTMKDSTPTRVKLLI